AHARAVLFRASHAACCSALLRGSFGLERSEPFGILVGIQLGILPDNVKLEIREQPARFSSSSEICSTRSASSLRGFPRSSKRAINCVARVLSIACCRRRERA